MAETAVATALAQALRRRKLAAVAGEPNELVTPIHNRMPAIVQREARAQWIGEEPPDKDALLALLKPFPAERVRAYAVSAKVNSVKNDEPSLLNAATAIGRRCRPKQLNRA